MLVKSGADHLLVEVLGHLPPAEVHGLRLVCRAMDGFVERFCQLEERRVRMSKILGGCIAVRWVRTKASLKCNHVQLC